MAILRDSLPKSRNSHAVSAKWDSNLPNPFRQLNLRLLLGMGMNWRYTGLAARGRRRGRPGAGAWKAASATANLAPYGVASRDSQGGPRVAIAALLLLAGVDFLDATENIACRWRRHPVQVLFQMSSAALATARLVSQVIALLGPEILVALPLGPRAGPSACL